MIRFIGALLILAGCLGMGWLIKWQQGEQIRTLRELSFFLSQMESEVRYSRGILRECCIRAANRMPEEYRVAAGKISDIDEVDTGSSFAEQFGQAFEPLLMRKKVKMQERQVFMRFLTSRGLADENLQLEIFRQSMEELDSKAKELHDRYVKNGNTAVVLGTLTGVFILLILG